MSNPIWARKKICLVDDDENLREIYSLAFNREGFDVALAKDGEEGMALIKKEQPDVILLDLQMPVKNGFDVLRELGADPVLAKIPVVVLSNVDDEAAFKKVGKYETRFYLVKALTTPQKAIDIVREIMH
ncbi:MAG: response regulator [Candidatus Moraniibacteriota bacterium]